MQKEEFHAALDCLASDLLKVKHVMEDRGRPASEIAKLDDAFQVLINEAHENARSQ